MKTIQATDDLTLKLYPPPPAGQPFRVPHSKAAEIDEECPGGIVVYANEIHRVIEALTEAAMELADAAPCYQMYKHNAGNRLQKHQQDSKEGMS